MPFDLAERLGQRHLVVERIMFGADDPAQILDPAQPFVAGVPHQAQPAAGAQHPADLLDGPLGVEPVPGLGHQHRVDAVVGQRDLLGRAAAAPGCPAVSSTAAQAFPGWDRRRSRRAPARRAGWSACRCLRQGPAHLGRPREAASRSSPADTTAGRVRMPRLLSRRTGNAAWASSPLCQLQRAADQLAHHFRLDQEAVVAVRRVDDVQAVAAGQQLGQFLL